MSIAKLALYHLYAKWSCMLYEDKTLVM